MNETQPVAEKPTILVVDDTPDNIALLTSLLRGLYKTKVATNGSKALEVATTGAPPDLVLLDIMMPEMDGYEVCRRMKEHEKLRDMPIIFLSSLSETVDKVKAFGVGGVDYVTKPFQIEEVRARVDTHLKIRRLQAELEKQNQQLQESYEQLSRLSAQKDEFLRIASHDLKNPLACVLGFASVIEDAVKPGEPLNSDMHGFLAKITSSARLMQKIIEDFLDFHAMEDGQIKLSLEPTALNDLARQSAEQNQAYAEKKSIQINSALAADLPRVRADASRIRQVVENFVSNAVKFSQAGCQVTVRTQPQSGFALVEVVDSGPGLTDDDLKKLFTKYAKLSNKPTGGEKSSGLGLAICKKIIDLHGGTIGARNNPGGGCTFWFQLPVLS